MKRLIILLVAVINAFVFTGCKRDKKDALGADAAQSAFDSGNYDTGIAEGNDEITEQNDAPVPDNSQTYSAGMPTDNGKASTDTGSNPTPSGDTPHTANAADELRTDYNLGTCRNLSGDVTVVLFYMEDSQGGWEKAKAEHFKTAQIEPGLDFLEKEAEKRGIYLNFDIKETHLNVFYNDDVVRSTAETGLATIDVLWVAANGIGYSSDNRMVEELKAKYQTDEVICLSIFNKGGTAYAINPPRGSSLNVAEHCIIFVKDLYSVGKEPDGSQSSVIAHEILHLYGAEDFYECTSRKALARQYYPSDIMLSTKYSIQLNNIGDATAFYIGWTDKAPKVLYNKEW